MSCGKRQCPSREAGFDGPSVRERECVVSGPDPLRLYHTGAVNKLQRKSRRVHNQQAALLMQRPHRNGGDVVGAIRGARGRAVHINVSAFVAAGAGF
jgi:hypothetical protein